MKASELRLGNFILHNGEICTVFSLSKLWLRVTKDRNVAISYDNLEGIPLTEEWLLKFGFTQSPSARYNFFKTRNTEDGGIILQ